MQYSTNLQLHFATGKLPELMRVIFNVAFFPKPLVGIRGIEAPSGMQAFRWSTTSHALALFFVRAVEHYHEQKEGIPVLEGYRNCPAATLARLLTKRPDGWLLDVFGYDSAGRTLLMKIVRCANYTLSMPGPMQIYMRTSFLRKEAISIVLDGKDITSDLCGLKQLSQTLAETWEPRIVHESQRRLRNPSPVQPLVLSPELV